jgi:5-methylcytosine-specific restriction endonuclease McrA
VTYCEYGCVDGWSELESEFGQACPHHKREPKPLELDEHGRPIELMRMPYRDYLKSEEWQRKRRHVLARGDNRCKICGVTSGLDVHHLTYEHRGYESADELVVLCHRCHGAAHELLPKVTDITSSSDVLQRLEESWRMGDR